MEKNEKHILVVDDNPDILDAVQMILENEGYIVTISQKGDYAENVYGRQERLPDLILLDMLLSGQDGRTICQKLKNQDTTRHIPIIMISAHPTAHTSVQAVGADAFLAKPFQLDDLLQTVQRYIGKPQE